MPECEHPLAARCRPDLRTRQAAAAVLRKDPFMVSQHNPTKNRPGSAGQKRGTSALCVVRCKIRKGQAAFLTDEITGIYAVSRPQTPCGIAPAIRGSSAFP